MATLIGFIVMIGLLGGGIYLIIKVIKGRKAVYRQTVDKTKMERFKAGEKYIFKRNIIPSLIFPIGYLIAICGLFFYSTDVGTASFSVALLSWFMVIKIYFVIRSRKDKVVVYGNTVAFYFEKGEGQLNTADFQELNLEFRRATSYDGSVIVPFLNFTGPSKTIEPLTNAAVIQYPYEVAEAIGRLNPGLRLRKSWNDTIKKKTESVELQRAV